MLAAADDQSSNGSVQEPVVALALCLPPSSIMCSGPMPTTASAAGHCPEMPPALRALWRELRAQCCDRKPAQRAAEVAATGRRKLSRSLRFARALSRPSSRLRMLAARLEDAGQCIAGGARAVVK